MFGHFKNLDLIAKHRSLAKVKPYASRVNSVSQRFAKLDFASKNRLFFHFKPFFLNAHVFILRQIKYPEQRRAIKTAQRSGQVRTDSESVKASGFSWATVLSPSSTPSLIL